MEQNLRYVIDWRVEQAWPVMTSCIRTLLVLPGPEQDKQLPRV